MIRIYKWRATVQEVSIWQAGIKQWFILQQQSAASQFWVFMIFFATEISHQCNTVEHPDGVLVYPGDIFTLVFWFLIEKKSTKTRME